MLSQVVPLVVASAEGRGGDWFMIKKGVEAACAEMDLPHLLTAIRLGGCLGEPRDLALHLGVWMRELGYLEAIRYFEFTRAGRGMNALVAYNLAFCHLGQQRTVEAVRFVEEAIDADSTMAEAWALRTEIRAILRDEAAA